MEYDGNVVGPRLRELRKNRKMTLDEVSELTGLSISTLKQLEQGGRRLSIGSLYLFMDAYQCDANTLLNIATNETKNQPDLGLDRLPHSAKEKCMEVFGQVVELLINGGRNNA